MSAGAWGLSNSINDGDSDAGGSLTGGTGDYCSNNPDDPVCGDEGEEPVQCNFSDKQLQKKYKHAVDFGVDGNANKANLLRYQNALKDHINSPNTQVINGTYRWEMQGTHFYNPKTGNWVFRDANGNFHTGWRLSQRQTSDLLTKGNAY